MHPAFQRRLLECYEIARKLGGVCLSPHTTPPTGELRWRCAAGHEWTARTAAIVDGHWCTTCERRAPVHEHRLAQLQALAIHHGGACLSESYVRDKAPMRWRCGDGHEWESSSNSIRRGSWCPFCSGRRTTLEALHELAAARGGECLAPVLGRKSDPHRWRCARGHEWSATPLALIKGSWCPTCAGRNTVTIATLQELARSRGGECLTRRFRSLRQHVRWRCDGSHEWIAEANSVKRGSWCPVCAGNSRGDLTRLRTLARAHGGRCLATTYVNSRTPVPWRCAEGHIWSAVPGPIVAGNWCPTCSRTSISPQGRTYADLAALCRERGGRVLLDLPGDALVLGQSQVTFQCAQGHTWTTLVRSVRRGHWCHECAGVARGDLAALQALAAERGGRCLAPAYIDNRTPIPFECAEGHRWNARPFQVKRTWCPQCAPTARLDLKTLQADARARGGRCLAKEIPGRNQPIAWACDKDHRWMARPISVHNGTWCPTCRGLGTYTLARAKKVAAQHGGECLSPACSRAADPLTWRCHEGHMWVAAASNVLSVGSWCPRCGRQKAAKTRRERDEVTG